MIDPEKYYVTEVLPLEGLSGVLERQTDPQDPMVKFVSALTLTSPKQQRAERNPLRPAAVF